MSNFTIKGVGAYLPEFALTNEILEKMVDTNDEWITKRVGIKERRISTGEPTWYMAFRAAKDALEDSGIDKEDIDLILCTSVTCDYFFPSMSCIVQKELGAVNAACMDLNAACAGFVYALDIAHKYLSFGEYKNILIVSADILSKNTDYTDRSTCILFGDGAGAAVVSSDGEGKFLSSWLMSDGTGAGSILGKALSVDSPFVDEKKRAEMDMFPESTNQYFVQNGQAVFKFATKVMVESCLKVVEKAGLSIDDIDYIVPHQANARIIDFAAKRLNIGDEKVINIIEHIGNTSSSTIPIALNHGIKNGTIKRKNKLIFTGFGAGLVAGAALIEY